MNSDLASNLAWWKHFWAENDRCLYGDNFDTGRYNQLPVFPVFTTNRPRVPVLVELGEDWIVEYLKQPYHRYIKDFEFQQKIRDECAVRLVDEIGLVLKPKVDTSSLLHGSIYGNPIEYPEESTPWLQHIAHSADDFKKIIRHMQQTDLTQAGLVPWFVAGYRKLSRPYRWRILHDPTSVHGPATILSFLCGINDLGFYLYDQPDLMMELLDTIGNVTVDYSLRIRKLTKAPETGVGIFDDVAGLISPRQFRQFFLPVYEKIIARLAPGHNDDRFYHNDARIDHLLDMLAGLGLNGINPDPQTDPALIRRKLPEAIIYGCIPPFTLKNGTPHEIKESARRSIELVGREGGLVLTTAGSINQGTPFCNLEAMCRAAEEFGKY